MSIASSQIEKVEEKELCDRQISSVVKMGFFCYLILIFFITSYVSILSCNMEVLLKVITPLLQFQELILLLFFFFFFNVVQISESIFHM